MTEKKAPPRHDRPSHEDTQIIGFRLPISLAKAIKVEAARRQMPLNGLLADMWKLYRETKRAS